jgi:hypothetical protein
MRIAFPMGQKEIKPTVLFPERKHIIVRNI